MTTRVCHSKGIVELADRHEAAYIPYQKNIKKFVSTPANANVRRVDLEDRLAAMSKYANNCDINRAGVQ